MLCYLGNGARQYGLTPSQMHIRKYWEFQAVTTGKIAMTLPNQAPVLRTRTLWLSTPGHAHGWTGNASEEANIVVFHFLTVPELISQRFLKQQTLAIKLSTAQCNRLQYLADSVSSTWKAPQPDMMLRHEHLLLELSLMVLADTSGPQPRIDQANRERVDRALNWFNLNMQFNPSLEEVAAAAGSSPAHLRRLFHEVMQDAPKKVFDQLRFQRAIHLMTDHAAKLESVSEACGFQSASAFSRAFKNKFGCPPNEWRSIPNHR